MYDALKGAHAAIIMTEWEFTETHWEKLVNCKKPFWVFDSRLVLIQKDCDWGINLWQLGYGKTVN